MATAILSAAQARERQRAATGETAHCLCRLDVPCTCGLEAPLIQLDRVDSHVAGWTVQR